MNKNSCKNYEECVNREMNDMEYPIDDPSLYMDRLYDQQTANRRCYEKNPINIVEGFGMGAPFTWDKIFKIIVVILLIIVFISLVKDFIIPKQEIKLDVASPTDMQLTAIPGVEQF